MGKNIGEGNEMYLLNTRGVAAFKTIMLRINKNLGWIELM